MARITADSLLAGLSAGARQDPKNLARPHLLQI